MKVLTNPKVVIPSGIVTDSEGGTVYPDGTFLHRDVVLERAVKTLTPLEVYNNNVELIDAFTKTVVNYAPVSINLMDYWNKRNLEPFCIPLDEKEFDGIPKEKIFESNGKKAFFVNSIRNLQEKLAEMYMNNTYTTVHGMKNDHKLRQKILQIFRAFDIPEKDKVLLFDNVNDLFKEERFVTNKDVNMKKGKVTALKYQAKSAWKAKIEGPLTGTDFNFDYETKAPFEYKVESVILEDIYRAFVRPLAHPLGMIDDYKKVCLADFTDRVLSRLKYRAEAISVKCTHPSDQLPTLPPPRDYGIEKDPNYVPGDRICTERDVIAGICPRLNQPYRKKLKYPGSRTNNENVIINEKLVGPWDPATVTTEKNIATKDGLKLWSEIADMDEGQGNILVDIERGYGEEDYSGMEYTKYIFENGAYLIEYECKMENGKPKRLIEYFRYNILDTTLKTNIIAGNSRRPGWIYDTDPVTWTNMVHGKTPIPAADDKNPLRRPWAYATAAGPDAADTRGLDIGVWSDGTNAATTQPTYDTDRSYITFNKIEAPATNGGFHQLCIVTYLDLIDNYDADINSKTANVGFNVEGPIEVFAEGLKVQSSQYNAKGETITFGKNFPIVKHLTVNTLPPGTTTKKYLATQAGEKRKTFEINGKSNAGNVQVFVAGKLQYTSNNEYKKHPKKVVLKNAVDPETVEIVETTSQVSIIDKTVIKPTEKHTIGLQAKHASLFVDGKLTEIFAVNIKHNLWELPGSYKWQTNTNIIGEDRQLTPVYSLAARWIEKKECLVNVYDLQTEEPDSIEDEFRIIRINFEKNIVNNDTNKVSRNVINNSITIPGAIENTTNSRVPRK